MPFSFTKPGVAEYVSASLILCAGAALLAPVVSAQTDRNRACVDNMYRLTAGVL
ncbi:MAG: hypothetical protein H7Y38_20320 [Armatimonadetes bacterium]|nr:hypothetical protein [Armatimonadota bacterium]